MTAVTATGTTDRTATRPALDFEAAPPTVDELGRAWAAVRAGRFRGDPLQPARPARLGPDGRLAAAAAPLPGAVVTVVGAHGWSGASTTALLLAESAARAGGTVRLVDAADPVQSGLIGAAVTEHGYDQSGQWRRGLRVVRSRAHPFGQLRMERLDRPADAPLAVPAAAISDGTGDGTSGGTGGDVGPGGDVGGNAVMTVVDAGWPLPDLVRLAEDPVGQTHWLGRLIRSSTLVLTAQATVPGLQRAAAAADQLQGLRSSGPTRTAAPGMVLVLVGAHRLTRLLADVVATTLPAISAEGRLVLVPSPRDFAVQGVTTSDLPKQLTPAGVRLLEMTGYPPETGQPGSPAAARRRRGEQ